MGEEKKGTRRRGEALEEAILLAAWDELRDVGLAAMSMESVAARAGTNKAVLYRRWENKTALVVSAIHKHLPHMAGNVPNTGNLRDDVFEYLNSRAQPLRAVGAKTMASLIMEPEMWQVLVKAIPRIVEKRTGRRLTLDMPEILKNAELRGELRLRDIPPRVLSLPLDLFQYEVVTKMEPVSEKSIAEIVDDVFIPLIGQYGISAP